MKEFLNKLQYVTLLGVPFVMPLGKRIVPIAIVVYVISFVLAGGWKEKWQRIRNAKYVRLTSLYYLFLLIGVAYSEQIEAAWFDLEVKLSMLLFPIMLSAQELTRKQFKTVLYAFLMGCFTAMLICIGRALFIYLTTGDYYVFFYQRLSIFHHPTYISMYINFAIIILYYLLVYDRPVKYFRNAFWPVTLIALFSVYAVLLSSKLGMITLLLLVIVGTTLWFLKSRALFPSILVFLMLSGIIYVSNTQLWLIKERLDEAVDNISDDTPSYSTTGARKIIWGIALEMVIERPLFGYGTGDVKAELMKKYDEQKHGYLVEQRLNAHNEYLQMLIAIGLIGSVFFWLYLYGPFLWKVKFKELLLLGLMGLITLNCLTESLLETQAGVVFYAFFNALLFFNRNNQKEITLIDKKQDP